MPRALPPWLKVRLPAEGLIRELEEGLRSARLRTVCEECLCPNLAQCFQAGVCTILLMGPVCTRNCRFCNVTKGRPHPLDPREPEAVAEFVASSGWRYVVITSVTRDDLAHGGAAHIARTVALLKRLGVKVEVLVPDFQGSRKALEVVLASRPDVLGHNVETVPRLYPSVRPGASYARSLQILAWAKEEGFPTKSGLMLGLGEEREEVEAVLRDLRSVGCDAVAIGQYLPPSPAHLPAAAYVPPEEFASWAEVAKALGFSKVASGPLVRSSYHAALI